MDIEKSILDNREIIKKLLILFFVLIVIDQLTKTLAQKYLENSEAIVLMPGFLRLNFLRNEIRHLHQYFVYFVMCFIVIPWVILYSISKSFSKLIIIAFIILWSAIISNNIIDVFLLGYIRDFIELRGVATGNIADQYRTLGAVLLVLGILIKDQKKPSLGVILKIVGSICVLLLLMVLFWRYLAKYMPI